MNDWEAMRTVLKRYCPEGKRVCNCSSAYETYFPGGAIDLNGNPIGHWACEHGCSTARIDATTHIAKSIIKELGIPLAP